MYSHVNHWCNYQLSDNKYLTFSFEHLILNLRDQIHGVESQISNVISQTSDLKLVISII